MNVEEFNENFQPCIIDNLPESDYHKVRALSNSGVEDFLDSPGKYQFRLSNPRKQTESMKFGTLIHAAILEPDKISRYVARPEGMKFTTVEGKAWKKTQEESGKIVVDAEDLEAAARVSEEIKIIEDEGFSAAVELGKKELSLFWICNKGVRKKARLDIYTEEVGVVIDAKTTRNSSSDSFERTAWDSGYHRKAAWYKEALQAHNLPFHHFLWIAIENDDFCDFEIFRSNDETVRVGEMMNDEVVDSFIDCQRTGIWPRKSKKIQPLSFPSYIINTLPEKYLG